MNDRRQDDDTLRLDWGTVRQLAAFMRPYRLLLLQLTATMLTFALLDAAVPLLTRIAIDRFAVPRQTHGLRLFAGVCVLFAFARGAVVWWLIRTGGRIHTRVSGDIRREGFTHLQRLSFSYFDQHAVGWLLSRLTSDALELGRFFAWGVVDMVDGVGRLLIMTVIMFALDAKLALVVVAAVPPMVFVIARFQLLTLAKFRAVRKANSELTGVFDEGIVGARTTKTLVREDANLAEFSALAGHVQECAVSAARSAALYFPFVVFIATLAAGVVVWVGGAGVLSGRTTYGTLVAFVAYASSFFQPMKDLARRFPQFQNAQAAAERILSMLETEPEITDTPAALTRQADDVPTFRGLVEFEDVSFRYHADEPVLEQFSLAVQPGETIALVGETGSGKSTIVNLICRFYEPWAGTIRIDGEDYRRFPLAWLRQNLGIVQQTPHLFSGTVRENIRYGRLDASEADIEQAARLVNAHDFISVLEHGYDFAVGEGGTGLSMGQKQLISLARVIVADPALLILDEATSSVDTETERLIQDAIDKVLEHRTSFVIAHRLSTIRRADRILLIRDGRVVEQGTHHELIRLRGEYFALYSSQFVEERSLRLLSQSGRDAPGE